MKKTIVLLLVACLLVSAVGCSALNQETTLPAPTKTVFSIDSYGLQLTADSTFYEKTGGSFDLQITNDYSFISVMPYRYTDLPEGATTLDGYDIQNEELFSKRTAVTVIKEQKTHSLSQGTATYTVYSAEKDGVVNYYGAYLLDFPNEEVFAWVLITATPEYYTDQEEYLHNFVCSLAPIQ